MMPAFGLIVERQRHDQAIAVFLERCRLQGAQGLHRQQFFGCFSVRRYYRVLPGGEVVGIDIQPNMIDRLKRNADTAGVTNLTAILGDATQPHVTEGSFNLAFLCTTLGEIPDRRAALAQCYRALKPGGRLSITELIPDPLYQSRSTVRSLAEKAGFLLVTIEGGWWFYTATFVKPQNGDDHEPPGSDN